jgi:hypothetical protein
MLVLRFSQLYAMANAAALRPGTVALHFNTGGTVVMVQNGETVTLVGATGTTVETGPIDSITSITTAVLVGCLGR